MIWSQDERLRDWISNLFTFWSCSVKWEGLESAIWTKILLNLVRPQFWYNFKQAAVLNKCTFSAAAKKKLSMQKYHGCVKALPSSSFFQGILFPTFPKTGLDLRQGTYESDVSRSGWKESSVRSSDDKSVKRSLLVVDVDLAQGTWSGLSIQHGINGLVSQPQPRLKNNL